MDLPSALFHHLAEEKKLLHTLFPSWKLHKLCYEINRGSRLQAHLTNTKKPPPTSSGMLKAETSTKMSADTRSPSSSANNADKTITAAAAVVNLRLASLSFNKFNSVQVFGFAVFSLSLPFCSVSACTQSTAGLFSADPRPAPTLQHNSLA